MPKYKKKPVIVDAEQWLGSKESFDKILGMGLNKWKPGDMGANNFTIETLEGDMLVILDDWVIKEPFPTDNRKFYPCKPDIFEATYELITS